MIINYSRGAGFIECRRKQFNWDERRLVSWREPDPLISGGGFHHGVAHLFSTGNAEAAVTETEKEMRARYAEQMLLPEEKPFMEQQIEWTRRAVRMFAEQYAEQDIQVLWPEVEFCIPLPNTWHHCFFMHRFVHPNVPFEKCAVNTSTLHGDNEKLHEHFPCWMPHFFRGKTDAVVSWKSKVWLFEHKTNSLMQDIFFKKYLLDAQATGYMYGIWKQMNVLPSGFILNVIQKPNKRAKDQLQVGFAREPYFRTTEDLTRFEREFSALANDYERSFSAACQGDESQIYMNTKACTNWNRQCYYMDSCQRHFEVDPDEFRLRGLDYVEEEYYRVAGLPIPEKDTEVLVNISLEERNHE